MATNITTFYCRDGINLTQTFLLPYNPRILMMPLTKSIDKARKEDEGRLGMVIKLIPVLYLY